MGEDLGEGSARRVKINESTTLSPSPSPSERVASGFTLAETLITLVIVGVVAALTVPTLIAKYQEQQTVTALKKFYSEISQAYNAAIAKNGPPETWEWEQSGAGAEHIMDIFAPHLRIMNRCGAGGSKELCFGDKNYKNLIGEDWGNPALFSNGVWSSARLDNGYVFQFWSAPDNSCSSVRGTSTRLQNVCGQVFVDINGYKKPNTLGKDTFYFWITKYGIIPKGTKGESTYTLEKYCNRNINVTDKGMSCAAWIIEKGNMDYLHQDVHW